MKIAVLGWGSLIPRPGELRIAGTWQNEGPVLPLEFSRISNSTLLTLVIDETNGVSIRVLYAISAFDELLVARENLQVRERVPSIESIGYANLTEGAMSLRAKKAHPKALDAIADWARNAHFDAVIWTALKPKFVEILKEPFTPERAANYVLGLPEPKRSEALDYVQTAPAVVQTRVRTLLAQSS